MAPTATSTSPVLTMILHDFASCVSFLKVQTLKVVFRTSLFCLSSPNFVMFGVAWLPLLPSVGSLRPTVSCESPLLPSEEHDADSADTWRGEAEVKAMPNRKLMKAAQSSKIIKDQRISKIIKVAFHIFHYWCNLMQMPRASELTEAGAGLPSKLLRSRSPPRMVRTCKIRIQSERASEHGFWIFDHTKTTF